MSAPLLLALLAAATLPAAPVPDSPAARVRVDFREPAAFVDAAERFPGDPRDTGHLDRLRDHLVRAAEPRIPAGHRLEVTFTAVDLAGEFEPWRGPQWGDVRIVRDLYPPRLGLEFRLVDAAGRVARTGRRELSDLAFLMKLTGGFRDDPLRHEKALLDDWLRAEFPGR
jgi:hypothetical protein